MAAFRSPRRSTRGGSGRAAQCDRAPSAIVELGDPHAGPLPKERE